MNKRTSCSLSENIFDSLQVNIAVVDKTGVINKVNRAWEDFARGNSGGKTVSAWEGENYFEVCRKAKGRFSDEASAALRGFEAILAGQVDHFYLEYPCHSPEEKRWFLMHAVPLQSRTGGIVISHINISKQKKAEAALQEKEHLLSESQRIAHIGSWSWDLTGQIKWTDETYRIYGVSPETFIPTVESLVNLIHVEDRPIMQRWIEACGKGQSQEDLEFRVILPDGSVRLLSGRGELIYATEYRSDYMTGTVQDITDRSRAELELRNYRENLENLVKERTINLEAKKHDLERSQTAMQYLLEDVNEAKQELKTANIKLRELDRLKSMFIASMSHELRTPLNSIIGFTGMTLQGLSGELNEEQRDNLERVYKAAKHLLSLISDVIDISKVEAGRVDVFIEEFALDGLLDEAAAVVRPQLKEKGLSLEVNVEKGLTMRTDRKRLLQCVLNFLSNAVKFTEKGSICVGAGLVPARKEKGKPQGSPLQNFVEISVSDTGIGIAEEDIPRLFEAFERLQSHLRVKVGGTGLGLYLTRKLATELLHGSVSVKSELGKGSVFSIKVPRELKK